MIGYVTVGTNNMEKAVDFYDGVFEILQAKKIYEFDRFVGWKFSTGEQMFAVVKPYDGNEASNGNGVMIALLARDPNQVESLHQYVLSQGGQDEGAPGVRQGSFYCAYCRDLDGNKLNFYCLLPKD